MKAILLAVFLFILFYSFVFAQTPQIVWAKSLGGLKNDNVIKSVRDMNGNIYCLGQFEDSIDVDPSIGKYMLYSLDSNYVNFVLKLDSNGNFIFANTFGTSSIRATAITIDHSNNVILCGLTQDSIDLNWGSGVAKSASWIFVEKIDPNGNFIWAKSFGGHGGRLFTYLFDITTDNQNNILTVGEFDDSLYFDPVNPSQKIAPPIHAFQTNFAINAFVHKLDLNGNFIWVKTFGSDWTSWASHVVTDINDNVYIAGMFNDTCDFNPGAGVFNLIDYGHQIAWDIFIQKLNANGNFVWAKSIGGNGVEHPNDLKIDRQNNLYLVGDHTDSIDIDPDPASTNFLVGYEGFLEKIDTNGNLFWAKTINTTSMEINNSKGIIYCPIGNFLYGTADTIGYYVMDTTGIISTSKSFKKNTSSLASAYISSVYGFSNHLLAIGSFKGNINIDTAINCSLNSLGNEDIMIAKIIDCNVLPTSNYTIAPDPSLAHNWLTTNLSINASSYLWHWDDGSQPTNGMNAQHTFASPDNYNICLTAIATNGCHSTYCDSSTYIYRMKNGKSMISVNAIASGINAINKKYEFELYPNPTNKQLIVDSEISINNLEITDLSGRVLVNLSTPNSNIINVENLSNGFYFLKIRTQNQEILQLKFVKE